MRNIAPARKIVDRVCDLTGTDRYLVAGRSGSMRITEIRSLSAYILHRMGYTYLEITIAMRRRAVETVVTQVRVVSQRIEVDKPFKSLANKLFNIVTDGGKVLA